MRFSRLKSKPHITSSEVSQGSVWKVADDMETGNEKMCSEFR